jgi:hypothetical protein
MYANCEADPFAYLMSVDDNTNTRPAMNDDGRFSAFEKVTDVQHQQTTYVTTNIPVICTCTYYIQSIRTYVQEKSATVT